MTKTRWLPIILAVFFLCPLTAQAFPCHVRSVHDGDTLTCDTGQRVRLAMIDAPELSQPYGVQAGNVLRDLVNGQMVDVHPTGRSYDRVVGTVSLQGKDAGSYMVWHGDAWAEPRYHPPAFYIAGQDYARRNRIGLWRDDVVMPPWEWRHRGVQ